MAIVKIDKRASSYPVLEHGGMYGPGLQHEADVELTQFECPAEKMPAYDRDGERGPYAYFGLVVITSDGERVFVDHWESIAPGSGSKALVHLKNAGVAVSEDGEFDDSDVAPRKLGGIQVADARPSKDGSRLYNGKLLAIVGN